MLVKQSNWRFPKNVKTCLQNKKLGLMPPWRHGHFHPTLILPVKMVVTAATYKYYCPLVVNPTITNCCKEFHLKCGRIPRSVFENVAIHENFSSFVWKPVFFLIISKCCHFYWKSLLKVFFSVTFYSMIKYFWSAF